MIGASSTSYRKSGARDVFAPSVNTCEYFVSLPRVVGRRLPVADLARVRLPVLLLVWGYNTGGALDLSYRQPRLLPRASELYPGFPKPLRAEQRGLRGTLA